jgi:hypothetical protein
MMLYICSISRQDNGVKLFGGAGGPKNTVAGGSRDLHLLTLSIPTEYIDILSVENYGAPAISIINIVDKTIVCSLQMPARRRESWPATPSRPYLTPFYLPFSK